MNETVLTIEKGCVTLILKMRIEPPDIKIIKRFLNCAKNIYGDQLLSGVTIEKE